MDADLQDPPELIPQMLRVAREQDADVVYAVRSDRSTDTRFKRWSAHLFYRLIGALTDGTARSQSGDFRLMSRALVDAVTSLPETSRVIRFVVPALGFPSASIDYRRERRAAGRAKYGLRAMVQLSLDSITGVSIAPLRLATYVGLGGGLLALVVGVATIVAHYGGRTLPGWTSTVAIVSAFSALQLLCLGTARRSVAPEESLPEAAGLSAATSTDDPNGRSWRDSTRSST
jgi:dolichol-phosphate mannosyltransferase